MVHSPQTRGVESIRKRLLMALIMWGSLCDSMGSAVYRQPRLWVCPRVLTIPGCKGHGIPRIRESRNLWMTTWVAAWTVDQTNQESRPAGLRGFQPCLRRDAGRPKSA